MTQKSATKRIASEMVALSNNKEFGQVTKITDREIAVEFSGNLYFVTYPIEYPLKPPRMWSLDLLSERITLETEYSKINMLNRNSGDWTVALTIEKLLISVVAYLNHEAECGVAKISETDAAHVSDICNPIRSLANKCEQLVAVFRDRAVYEGEEDKANIQEYIDILAPCVKELEVFIEHLCGMSRQVEVVYSASTYYASLLEDVHLLLQLQCKQLFIFSNAIKDVVDAAKQAITGDISVCCSRDSCLTEDCPNRSRCTTEDSTGSWESTAEQFMLEIEKI